MQQAEQDQAALHLAFAIHRTHTQSRTSNRLSHIRKKVLGVYLLEERGVNLRKSKTTK